MSDHHYLIRGGAHGRERLRVLARVMRPGTLGLLDRAGVMAGQDCLDVGCGGGEVSLELATLVGLTGSVLGLDVDATKIELARADAEAAGLGHVEFRVADVTAGLGEAAYDVVYARFLLTHLADPAAALDSMRSALRPGGRLVVEDIDYAGSFCEPPSPQFDRYQEIYELTALRNGGDPFIGLKLPRLLREAGFGQVHPTISHPAGVEGEVKLLPPLTLENIRATAVRHEVATGEEVDDLVAWLQGVAADATTYVGNPHVVQVWGVR